MGREKLIYPGTTCPIDQLTNILPDNLFGTFGIPSPTNESKTPNIARPEVLIVIPFSVHTNIIKKNTIKPRQVNPQNIQKVVSNTSVKVVQNTERKGTLR